MALELLKNKLNSMAQANNTFALTPTDMANLDPSAATYSLNQLYSSLLVSLQAFSISTVRDALNGCLVFIPNARNLRAIIPTLGSTITYATPTSQNTPPAPSNNGYLAPVSSTFTSVSFTGNADQMLYRPMDTSVLQTDNYVSFWLRNNQQIFIGTMNDLNYASYFDGIRIGTANNNVYVNVQHAWLVGNSTHATSENSMAVYTNNNAFNHFVVGVGNSSHCYINGSYYSYTPRSNTKPATNFNGYFAIGRRQYLGQKAAAIGNIKNVSIFSSGYNTGNIMATLTSLGENGDPRSIGIQPINYWRLRGNTLDEMSPYALTNQYCNYVF